MNPLLKVLLALAVVLPLGGFVVGSLVSATNDDPPARAPIELTETPSSSPSDRPESPQVVTPRPGGADRDDDDDDGDDHRDWDGDDDAPQPGQGGRGDGGDDDDGDGDDDGDDDDDDGDD